MNCCWWWWPLGVGRGGGFRLGRRTCVRCRAYQKESGHDTQRPGASLANKNTTKLPYIHTKRRSGAGLLRLSSFKAPAQSTPALFRH